MANQVSRFLGEIDAAKDEKFDEHYVEALGVRRIIDNDSDIVYGAKGVGKTALARALTEINKDKYFATKSIYLNDISFSQVHAFLSKLNQTTHAEIVKLACNAWRNVLVIYGLEAIKETVSKEPLKAAINQIIEEEGFKVNNSNNRLINQIEKFLKLIASAGLEDREEAYPLGLSTNQLEIVTKFPYNEKLLPILNECFQSIKPHRKKALICLDGFDSIIDHTPESRKAIFAGLLDAIYLNSNDSLLSHIFCFKVFLPQELTDNLETVVWDADKAFYNTHYLQWSEEDLKKLLLKRLSQYSRSKSSNFSDVWNEFMPEKVKNPIHGNIEDSFSYILRHTLYRPRHILIQIQKILDRWDENNYSFKIDPTFIPKCVSETNLELSNFIVGQLEYRLPGLRTFLHSCNGLSNTMQLFFLRNRVQKIFSVPVPEANRIIDTLYNLGILGFLRKNDVHPTAKQLPFKFSYVNNNMGYRSIHPAIDDDDLLALSPMLHEFCGCKISEYGAIIPS